MRISAFVFGVVLIASCSSGDDTGIVEPVSQDSVSLPPAADTAVTAVHDSTNHKIDVNNGKRYNAEVFETPNLGWGYRIYDNGMLFINQPHIPAIQGNKGFSSREKARITADFAIYKLDQGFVPPTISPNELDSLGVLD